MTITAKVIEHSVSREGIEIATLQLRYQKFIHGEFLTHRDFSRSSASSRAIPVERMIRDVMEDPAMPVYWGKNQKGMQADEEMSAHQIKLLTRKWLSGRDDAVATAQTLMQDGLHKQIANRVLEPYFHINTLVTATKWTNFFELRCHKDAQPEMRELAVQMNDALFNSVPLELAEGEWHLPYITTEERIGAESVGDTDTLRKLSTARCARVSYLTQDGVKPQFEQDLALYDRLVGSVPLHASPAEHQATPDRALDVMGRKEWQHKDQWRNFHGWRQHRALIEQ